MSANPGTIRTLQVELEAEPMGVEELRLVVQLAL